MAGFLYFISKGRGSIDNDRAKELGIDYAFTGEITSGEVTNGPDGESGLIVVDKPTYGDDEACPAGYYPDKQRWQKMPGVDIWVGVYVDAMPGPEDLLTANCLAGFYLRMADGNAWQIPTIKMPSDAAPEGEWDDALPCGLALDDSGRPVAGGTMPQYRTILAVGERHVNALLKNDAKLQPTQPVMIENAVIVLAANYRIRMAEVVLLGLLTFDGPEARFVLDWAIGTPKLFDLDLKKKADSPGQPTSDGLTDDSPVTAQA